MSVLAVMLRLPVAMWALPGLLPVPALSSSGGSRPLECETCNASSTSCTGPMVTCHSMEEVCMTYLFVNITGNFTASTVEKGCILSDDCLARKKKNKWYGSISRNVPYILVNVTCTGGHFFYQDTVYSGSVRLAPSGLSLWVVLWQLVAGGFGVACISFSLEAILGLSKLICLPLYVLRSEN